LGALVAAGAALAAAAALAGELALEGTPTQGALLVGRVQPGSRVAVDGRPVRVSPEGLFLIGFGRDAPPVARLAVASAGGGAATRTIHVEQRTYEVQRIDGLPERQVTPDADTLRRIEDERAAIADRRTRDTDRPDFASGFAWPVAGTITGVFGSRRVLNGRPRSPHFGVDVTAPAGTPVEAAAAGTVTLAHADMFLTGKTVMIDHGHGLATVYAHMSEIAVSEGERVAKGQPIGRVGASGRATGPHLHWGVTLFETQLDPALLVGPMPASTR
jgi:murein DD-endopeptidase MepM/ murein hydrolase activator NlpD